jgi:hypothetical protein
VASLTDSRTYSRKAKRRQTECSPEKQLDWIEPAAGLFHIQLAVLVLLYRTHLGEDSDIASLNRWMKELRRVRAKLWNPHRQLVKDFHRSQDFFNIVLDGHILAYIAHYRGCKDSAALKKNLQDSPGDISEMIRSLSKQFTQWHKVHSHRENVRTPFRLHFSDIVGPRQRYRLCKRRCIAVDPTRTYPPQLCRCNQIRGSGKNSLLAAIHHGVVSGLKAYKLWA